MAAYYIDGDNNPGARTQGIEYLSDKDMATFFYAKGNTYYALEKNRKEWHYTDSLSGFYMTNSCVKLNERRKKNRNSEKSSIK